MFDWADYHELSADLLENYAPGLGEAAYRCAISRSYYAVYCSARDWAVQNHGLVIEKKGTDHGKVLNFFRNSRDGKLRLIGKTLENLLDDREVADYETLVSVGRKWAEGNIYDAGKTLNILAKL